MDFLSRPCMSFLMTGCFLDFEGAGIEGNLLALGLLHVDRGGRAE